MEWGQKIDYENEHDRRRRHALRRPADTFFLRRHADTFPLTAESNARWSL